MKFKWTAETKEIISFSTAILMLVFAIVIGMYGMWCPPLGEIHESILWVIAQCLIYAGSIFGITNMVKNSCNKIKKELQDEFNSRNKD